MIEPHPNYGPCDGFGPGGECSECAKPRFATEAAWECWLRSARVPAYIRQVLEWAADEWCGNRSVLDAEVKACWEALNVPTPGT